METLSRMSPLPNFLLYQTAWLACVMGAAHGQPMIGVAVAALVVALHLALARSSKSELAVIVLTGLIGGTWETLVVDLDWVRYLGADTQTWPPAWIIALWLAFATTFNVSLRWLQGHHVLAALLGLIGGPLAWYAGARLGALELPDPILALIAIGTGWAVLMPLLLFLAHRLSTQQEKPNV
jgi:hypothetical protein